MRIGLSFINQIESMPLPSPDSQAIARRSYEDRAEHAGGGWLAKQIKSLVAAITASYHTEHNENDSHSTIHATGKIYERGRTTALGDAVIVPYVATDFDGSGTMTWTVDSGDIELMCYWMNGSIMTFSFSLVNTTIGGAVSTNLRIKIPAMANSTLGIEGVGLAVDGGAAQAACRLTVANGTHIQIIKIDGTNWTAGANNTNVRGQIAFPVNGV